MMPRAAPCQCVCAHAGRPCGANASQSSRTTTVDSNMKSEHNLYLAYEDSHNVLSSFAFSLVLFASTVIDFVAFSVSMPPTVGCVQYSTPQNTFVVEDQPRCPTRPPLSRSAVLLCLPSIARLGISLGTRPSKIRGSGSETSLASGILACQCT